MNESPGLLVVAVLLGLLLVYRQALVFTRHVPPEYLNEQSVVDSVRNENELAVHKSTKLDYLQGLRVGLAIRYHHYKLRNGNLYDVWELALAHARKHPEQVVLVGKESITVPELHGQVMQIRDVLAEAGIAELQVPLRLFINEVSLLALVLACFVSQITVHVCDDPKEPAVLGSPTRVVADGKEIFNENNLAKKPSLAFENEYTFEKDRGIALRISKRTNHKASVTVSFTQSNLVSAVASCMKHLPAKDQLGPHDLVAIVQDPLTSEGVTNGIVKLLAGFVSGSLILLTNEDENFLSKQPTVVSARRSVIAALYRTPGLDLLFWHRMASLFYFRFSKAAFKTPYPRLRLLYAHRTIGQEDFHDWNSTRAALCTLVVEECGYFNVAGPVLVTDAYDFRFLHKVSDVISGYGCIVQADEVKLVEFGESGKVAVRGYNIGKANRFMDGVGEMPVSPDYEGFHILPVSAKWGSDGCLYVCK